MSFCQVDFNLKYVMLPERDLNSLEVEAKEIPILKNEDDHLLKIFQIIEMCKNSAIEKNIKITFEKESFAHQIFFQWATTNLLGLYVGLLYGDKDIRDRVYKDYRNTRKDLKEEDLDKISESMLQWSIHNDDISLDPKNKKKYISDLIENFDAHLEKSEFWFGKTISICDFALFSFCYMLYNRQFIYFHDQIEARESLFNWMKRLDTISRHDLSKLKIGA